MAPRILVIGSDEAIGTTIATIARHERWDVSTSLSIDMTLGQLDELNPDVIVLEFDNLRLGSGWQFLQVLKMDEETAPIPVIIVANTYGLPREVKGYLASRQVSVLPRPLDPDQFLVLARQLIARERPVLASGVERMPILLVEDNLELAEAFLEILELEGYLATTVPNGQFALDALKSGQYSLIFLDINMPVMNGLEFLAAYAKQPGPHTPVVIFSAYGDDTVEVDFPPFVTGHLAKDFQIDELLVFVNRYAEPA